jgi:hypothetical protein
MVLRDDRAGPGRERPVQDLKPRVCRRIAGAIPRKVPRAAGPGFGRPGPVPHGAEGKAYGVGAWERIQTGSSGSAKAGSQAL